MEGDYVYLAPAPAPIVMPSSLPWQRKPAAPPPPPPPPPKQPLSNRSNGKPKMAEAGKDLEVPIWVNGTQKWVTGLTKRTTCDDVIYALLFQDGLQDREHTSAYAIFEKWREVERPLQGRTKIMKVWRAWGAEKGSVYFSMRRIDELEYSGEFSLTRRKKRTRHRTRDRDRQSRDHHHRRHGYCQNTSERLKSMEQLVKLVISQERIHKDIIERIDDTDKLIDKYESKVHFSRMKTNGEDYVQNAYLESMSEDSMDDFFANVDVENIETYVQFCDKIINIEDQIIQQHSKMEDLSVQIEESFSEHVSKPPSKGLTDEQMAEEELAKLQVELNRAVSCAIMQQYKGQDLQRELQFYEEKTRDREFRLQQIQRELSETDWSDLSRGACTDQGENVLNSSSELKPPLPERARSLKTSNSNESLVDKSNSKNTAPVPERKPILKQPDTNLKLGLPGGSSKHSGIENKVRFKLESVVDKYRWEDSSVSEGISIDQSDCSDSKDLYYGFQKRDFQLPLVRQGMAGKPYQTVKVEENDSNSDTGLSSMHSDDSAVYHLETLV